MYLTVVTLILYVVGDLARVWDRFWSHIRSEALQKEALGVNAIGRFLQGSLFLCMLMSSGTLVFEVLLVPVAFALPLEARVLLILVSMGFHFGIGIAQSLTIGLCFMVNIATYVFAFGGNVEMLSVPWWVGVCLYIGIEGYVFLSGKLLAEDWPLTPVSA